MTSQLLKKLSGYLFLLFVVFVVACTSKHDRDISTINSLEEKVDNQAASPDTANLNELVRSYLEFTNSYPKDSLAPKYLYRAIRVTMARNDGQEALILIDRFINEYNNGPRYAEVVFLKAYTFENMLNNFGKASEIYRDFINKFPDHELADDAQIAIQNMGKTPEELIKEFEAKSAQNSAE